MNRKLEISSAIERPWTREATWALVCLCCTRCLGRLNWNSIWHLIFRRIKSSEQTPSYEKTLTRIRFFGNVSYSTFLWITMYLIFFYRYMCLVPSERLSITHITLHVGVGTTCVRKHVIALSILFRWCCAEQFVYASQLRTSSFHSITCWYHCRLLEI